MYPVTDAVKALYAAEQRQFLRITGTDKNGTAINITDANVVLGSFNIDRYSCNGNRLEVGTAIAAEMTVKLDNHNGTYNGIVFEGTELYVEIGIGDPVNWMPCGYFTPDEQPRTANQITIHALDRMVKFDNSVPGLLPWTTETGEVVTNEQDQPIYFMTDLAYPATIQSIIQTVCGYYYIPFTQDLSSFPNYNLTISEAPNLQQTTTFRNIIQWCAGIMGTCAWIDWTGSLRFSWYGATTGYVSTPANRFSSDLHEDDVEITGVQYTNLENYMVLAGRPEYTIDMTGNYLMVGNVTQILTTVNAVINGFTYRPFSATIINAPYLWPMDEITFTDKDGNNHTCVLTNVNFGINGAMSIEGKGESMQAASRDALSGMTKEQGVLVEQARKATQQLDNSLTQEEIFNRLTNNGEEQGIILYDGKIYVNASYIRGGIIDGDLVSAKLLNIIDADGNVIARFANVLTLGKTDEFHLDIDFNSIELKNANGVTVFFTGDIRDENGVADVSNTFISDGVPSYTLDPAPATINSVTVDGVEALYTLSGKTITLASRPTRFAEIVVKYTTNEPVYRYDIGNREDSGYVGNRSVASGYYVTASGSASFAEGFKTNAIGRYSHSEGSQTKALGGGSHAEGYETTTKSDYSHAEGYKTIAEGYYSHAEGYKTHAGEDASHAEGDTTVATGQYSHAEGSKTTASDYTAHAEGDSTTASAYASHSEGDTTVASGMYSHAEGKETTARGMYSHAEGHGTIAAGNRQHVFGEFNVSDATYDTIEIVGNGISDTSRHNARTLSRTGNEWIAGTLTQASDERLKTECGEVPDLSSIRARRFHWNDNKGEHDDDEHIGYFAQDVEKLAPYLVHEDAMGYKSLDYIALLCAKVDALEKRIAELEKQ